MHSPSTCNTDKQRQVGAMVGHSIDSGNLQFVKLVGVGTYGEVYHTVDRRNGESYAAKVLYRKSTIPAIRGNHHKSSLEGNFVDAQLLCREVALYSRISPHSNIIRLERMLHTREQLFMVLEHCSGGDLYENISSNPYFSMPNNEALLRRLFLQLVSAIEHCHKHHVYHRDIKPENVLVTRDGLNVKLIDFGLATDQPMCREIGCGSAYYMSPECQGGLDGTISEYAAAPNDVWALGIILINLTTGRNPWNRAHVSDPLFNRFLIDRTFLYNAIRATPEFAYIIHRVLDINPKTRCTLQELRQLVQHCPRFVFHANQNRHFMVGNGTDTSSSSFFTLSSHKSIATAGDPYVPSSSSSSIAGNKSQVFAVLSNGKPANHHGNSALLNKDLSFSPQLHNHQQQQSPAVVDAAETALLSADVSSGGSNMHLEDCETVNKNPLFPDYNNKDAWSATSPITEKPKKDSIDGLFRPFQQTPVTIVGENPVPSKDLLPDFPGPSFQNDSNRDQTFDYQLLAVSKPNNSYVCSAC